MYSVFSGNVLLFESYFQFTEERVQVWCCHVIVYFIFYPMHTESSRMCYFVDLKYIIYDHSKCATISENGRDRIHVFD